MDHGTRRGQAPLCVWWLLGVGGGGLVTGELSPQRTQGDREHAVSQFVGARPAVHHCARGEVTPEPVAQPEEMFGVIVPWGRAGFELERHDMLGAELDDEVDLAPPGFEPQWWGTGRG